MKMRPPALPPRFRRFGFTLIELLIVVGIIAVLMALIAPGLTHIQSGNGLAEAAYTIADALDRARNHAVAHNTYVWLGLYEENTTAVLPTSATPAYPGRGRLLMAIVVSRDGTKIFDNNDVATLLPETRIAQIGKLITIEGIHLTDIGPPPSPSPFPTPSPNSLNGRSGSPYLEGSPFDHYNRVSSESPDTTKFGFSAQGYTFYKTVRFSPRGEANLNSTYGYKHVAEIGLRPTHGTMVDRKGSNIVAIQFGAMGGKIRIYRQ